MREQRGYKRLDLDADICLKTGNGRSRLFNAYLHDISFGGLQMYAPEKIDIDEYVEFEVMTRLLDQPLQGRGVIRHINTIEKYKNRFFSMGVEFVDTNKKEVVCLIKKILGWKDELVYYKPYKRELLFLLRSSPIIIIITWLVLSLTNRISASAREEQKYTDKLKDAAIYYLYNTK